MATLPQRDSSNLGLHDSGSYHSQEKGDGVGRWYFLRKEIEENSPSRRDGIDLKKETFLRKSYCTFLQDLGMKLKVPQVTIATAIIFCHRFYLRQSHAKNDRRTISTACMFLAGKVEDTPRPLKDVIIVSYEIIYKKDSSAVQRIKQKEVYEQQKELVLLAERVVLATLSFDLNVLHPYKPLVDAIKRFNVAKHALAQVAWNFVNDGLRTSLCLQFKPDHIAAGAIFLAAKFLKVKLPFDGEKIWWLEFDVTPRQLEEVSNQMLELYEQNRVPPASQGSEIVDGGGATTSSRISSSKLPIEQRVGNANGNSSHSGGGASKAGPSRPTAAATLSHPVVDHGDNRGSGDPTRSSHSHSDDHREKGSQSFEDDRERNVVGGKRVREDENSTGKEKQFSNGNLDHLKGTTTTTTTTQSPAQGMIMIDEDKLKELREKRKKKSRVDMASLKKDSMDEFDPIVKELEEGVELAAAQSGKKIEEKRRRVGWDEEANGEDDHHHGPKSRGSTDAENVEEGEVSGFD